MKLKHLIGASLLGILMGSPQVTAEENQTGLVDTLIEPYLVIQTALAGDDLAATRAGATSLADAISHAQEDGTMPSGLADPTRSIIDATDFDSARIEFKKLSLKMMQLVRDRGVTGETVLYFAHCPMALSGAGASWIQADKTIANPYFGSKMLRCGSVREQIGGEQPEAGGS